MLDPVRGRELVVLARQRALIISGLSGLAVVQPLLDLFGANAQFFVAGHYTTTQIVLFALLIAVAPPLIGVGLAVAALLIDRRVGTVVFASVTGVLATAFVLALLRTLRIDAQLLVAFLAVGLAAGLAYVVLRWRIAQLFVSYLAVANLLFVGSFLFLSPTSALVTGAGSVTDIGEVTVDPKGPVVVIVFDELPAATIMRGDGTINATRYPGFAKLGKVSSWFRNASSPHHSTHFAVPSLLTGTVTDEEALPTTAEFPRNLFTLLGHDVPVRRFEAMTSMCPSEICDPPPPSALSQAFVDASIVYGHRVLPSWLRDDLPDIDGSWGDFGGTEPGGVGGDETGEDDETGEHVTTERAVKRSGDDANPYALAAARLRAHIKSISAQPTLHYTQVVFPHFPWLLSRSGFSTAYNSRWGSFQDEDPDTPGHEFRTRMQYQLHSMQVGATDRLIGMLVNRLQRLPSWKDTTLVVTSDHGTNFTSPDLGRKHITDHNREEAYRVPLFIKAPGQVEGEIRDEAAQTIDILPSLVDLLDASVDSSWEFDGHSLFDGSERHTEPAVSTDVDEVFAIAARRGAEFPHGDGWLGLAAHGAQGDLVGARVDRFEVGERSAYRATIDQDDDFAELPTDDGTMPFALTGRVTTRSGDPPPELVVAVNGRIAGVVGGYRRVEDAWEYVGYVADLYRDGANSVVLYDVERSGRTTILHEVL